MSNMDFVENWGDVEGGSFLDENNNRSKTARTILEKAADIWWTEYVVPFRASQQVLFPEDFQSPISSLDELPEHTEEILLNMPLK